MAVIGSPFEDDYSVKLADTVLDGSMGLSTNLIERYTLRKLKFVHGFDPEGNVEDDLTPIIDTIGRADCVVFSTPVIFKGVSAQMKLLIDRLRCFLDEEGRPKSDQTRKAIIVVSSENSMDEAKDVSKRMESSLSEVGFETVGTILCDSSAGEDMPVLMATARSLGLELRNNKRPDQNLGGTGMHSVVDSNATPTQ